MPPEQGKNTGVLIRPPKSSAWIAGGESGIVPAVLEESGQFDVYLPDEEAQAQFTPFVFDTRACVTFSGLNDIETLLNRLRAKTLLPATHDKFLLDSGIVNKQSGKVNLSDRFTAKMSGTTFDGNYLEAVGDSIRHDGVVSELDYPFPTFTPEENMDGAKKWARYYQEIPTDIKDKARKFLDYFQVNYEWVALGTSNPAKLREELKKGPIQIAAAICSPWNSNDGMPPIAACGCGTEHATMIYGYRTDDLAFKDFDHYKSFRKLLAADYCIQWGMRYVLTVKDLTQPAPFKYTFKINLRFGAGATAEVKNLQRALQTLKRADGTPYMKIGVFGPFGPQTKTALGLFQTDNGITDPDGQGTNFGPQTRAKMNAKLNA